MDLSDHVKQITINYSAELKDGTAMSLTGRKQLGGLKDWSADIEFFQDYAASKVDATIFSLVGTQTAFEFRADSGSRSTTNPGFTGNGIISDYKPIAGTVGDAAMAPIKVQGSDGVPLARQTS